MITTEQWTELVVEAVGKTQPISLTEGIKAAGIAWAIREGSRAVFNPWDTEEPWPGSTDYNAVGVKNYPTLEAGVAATVATLNNGYYPAILKAIEDGDGLAMARAIDASPWGTSGVETAYSAVIADYPAYTNTEISETVNTPTSTPVETIAVDKSSKPIGVYTVDFPTLTLNATGAFVKNLQSLLNGKAIDHLLVDGQLGEITEGGVKAWQTSHGLTVDGIVGPQTWASIVEAA